MYQLPNILYGKKKKKNPIPQYFLIHHCKYMYVYISN